jgi:hypothetical protein
MTRELPKDASQPKAPGAGLQTILLHAFCLLVGFMALPICAWVVATGQLFTLDGLLMVAISLTVAAIFVGNTAWAVYNGEMSELFQNLRYRSAGAEPPSDSNGGSET